MTRFSGDPAAVELSKILMGTKILKLSLGFVSNFLLALGLLFLNYNWETYYRNFIYSFHFTLNSYILCATMISCVSSLFTPGLILLMSRGKKWEISKSLTSTFISMLVFGVISYFLGPAGYDFFMRVRGIFFAEWQFVTFFLFTGIPMALISGLTYRWLFPPAIPPLE